MTVWLEVLRLLAALALALLGVLLLRVSVDMFTKGPRMVARARQEEYGLKAWLRGRRPWWIA